MGSLAQLSEMAVMQILIPLSLLLLVSGRPQLQAFPNPAHTSLQDLSLSAHPNAAHTSALDSSLSAHPNAAHTRISADCARFTGAFPCAPGDTTCETDYKTSGCGRQSQGKGGIRTWTDCSIKQLLCRIIFQAIKFEKNC